MSAFILKLNYKFVYMSHQFVEVKNNRKDI